MRRYLITLAGLLLIAGSCVKEKPDDFKWNPGEETTIRVNLPGDAGTKVSITGEDNGLSFSWNENDCIRIISGSQSEVFTLSRIISPGSAEFKGNALSGSSFDILCPGTYKSEEEADSDNLTPVQDGNGSSAHLPYKALLKGVNTCKDIELTADWASSHGGSFKSGVPVRIKATLPSGATTVDNASIVIDGKDYELPLKNVDVSKSSQVLTAYFMLPWNDVSLNAGSKVSVCVTTADSEVFSGEVSVVEPQTLTGGRLNAFDNVTLTLEDFAGGDGTEGNPFIIANARQFKSMMDLYKKANPADKNSFKCWFKLIADVDASGITWNPLNNTGSFFKAIDFDGGGHTISGLTSSSTYSSFAGVLYGSVRNVTFDRANISGSTKKGVVAGFLGTTGLPGSCENVHVTNSQVSGGNYSGGFAGHVRSTGTIVNCSVEKTTVSSTSGYLGGFAAFEDITGDDKYQVPARFINCKVEDVTVTLEYTGTTELYTGGFMGCANTGAGFVGCTVKATVKVENSSMKDVGGFIGRASYACPTFRDCHVLEGSSVTANCAHVGGFVGYSLVAASYTDCSSAASVANESEYTGGFAGYSAGSSTFTACSASGNVTSTKHAGGFVGTAENSAFNDCFYTGGTVTEKASGKAQSGGFCGLATSGVAFRGCYVKNAVFSSVSGTYVGGFVGQLGNSYVGGNNVSATQCHVEGTTFTGSTNGGGFVGVQYDNISNCYVSGGTVEARGAHCGGFSGFVQNGNLQHCYSTASVNGASFAQVGGFAGIIYTTNISYCYAAGSVSASGSDIGAFIGKCDQQNSGPLANVSDCIGWNASLSFCGTNAVGASITNCYAGVEGTVTSQAKAMTWPNAVWDFSSSMPTLLDTPRRLKAAFIGDSITWQWAVTSRTDAKTNIVIPINPLPSFMVESGSNVITYFHPGFFTGNGYIDKGVSGQNTTQMLTRFDGDIIALNPGVVVIMGGTNDLAQGFSESQILANITAMAEKADAAGIKVVLCSVTPNNREYSRLSNPKTKGAHIIALNNLIKDYVASKGFTYCDYWSALVAEDGLAMDSKYCLYDDLHPNPDAYTVMEGIIKPIIESITE